MSVLSVAGFGVFVAGLAAVAFGIPIKEFSFGDTLIVSGAVVSCTGLMMISLSVVVRELRRVADQLGAGAVDSPSPNQRRNLLSASSRKEREQVIAERSGPAGLAAPAIHVPDPGVSRPASRAARVSDPSDRGAASVTVLKSGVVDGMAYSLYSDGTIDAQLKEGRMRFASVDQLRAHLDQGPVGSSPQ